MPRAPSIPYGEEEAAPVDRCLVPHRLPRVERFFPCLSQLSSQEQEADKPVPPPDPPAAEPGNYNQDTADPDIEATQNPSREFLKFANQALELNVSSSLFVLCADSNGLEINTCAKLCCLGGWSGFNSMLHHWRVDHNSSTLSAIHRPSAIFFFCGGLKEICPNGFVHRRLFSRINFWGSR